MLYFSVEAYEVVIRAGSASEAEQRAREERKKGLLVCPGPASAQRFPLMKPNRGWEGVGRVKGEAV